MKKRDTRAGRKKIRRKWAQERYHYRKPRTKTVTVSRTGARWNYEPCEAHCGTVIISESPLDSWWCAELKGQRRKCVRVTYHGDVFFLDDEDGSGSRKVFELGGGPDTGHSNIPVDDNSTFIPDDAGDSTVVTSVEYKLPSLNE